ncbi:hypothetical protein QYE76_029132 [Lolium multiflorum]|uniref:Uncharacterized protein n=1 Tax=Lolium multiflorum TaxID=4521 RepID=A0AAD8QQJ6_LOLMU|nr:hypothetical protein QYE76_029132 [Lolium multiflorum]
MYYRDCLDSCKAMFDANFEELMAEASQKKKNKKEGKRKTIEAIVNRAAKPPIQPSADPSPMKYTKTAAVPTLVIDATNIEAIADNIASTFDGADDQPPVVPAFLAHRCAAVFDAANWDKLL